ncbi:MAG: hypothetical protein K8U57_02765 [Planctomycetes bacterium]|nr:hypothetical protein [Planctomycetota bacterium]
MIRRLLLTTAASAVIFSAGCRHRCCLNDPQNRPAPYRPQAPNSPFLLPPAGVPTAPTPVPAPVTGPIVPGVGPDMRNYPPPPSSNSAKPAPEVLLPDPIPGSSSRSFSPNNTGQGLLGGPAAPRTEPPLATKPETTTGLLGFVKVETGLATGRKPALDGFESLKKSGYRTVIYLHATGADVSAAKDVAEARGLKFLAIETTPEKLPESLSAFNAAVGDKASRPIYVFDDDSVRTGALWYLHFRTVDAMNDDAARVRARPLGFTNQSEEAKAFDLAIQQYLATR